MTDLTTMHLKCLLEQSSPGPWEYDPGDSRDGRYIGDSDTWGMCIGVEANGAGSSCSDHDLNLAAAAPELAQEVIRLRDGVEQILEMCLLERDAAFQDSPMRAGEVAAFNLCAERLAAILAASTYKEEE